LALAKPTKIELKNVTNFQAKASGEPKKKKIKKRKNLKKKKGGSKKKKKKKKKKNDFVPRF